MSTSRSRGKLRPTKSIAEVQLRVGVADTPVTAPENVVTRRPKNVGSHFGREALLFSVVLFAVYVASPVISSGDSHFVIPTALSIERHRHAYIDDYKGQFSEAPWAVIKENGHFWNVYPIGVPFLVTPLVWTVDKVYWLFGKDLEAAAIRKSPMFLELVLASLLTATAAGLLFYHIRGRLSFPKAVLLAGLFALGTSAYSSASRGLWQHGPSMLLLVAAILVYERLPKWGVRGAVLLGIITGYSYAVRPANVTAILGFAILLAITSWRQSIPFLGGAVVGVAPLFAFHLTAFGKWSSVYYNMTQGDILSLSLPWKQFLAILISPSRGLFVFSPFLLFVFLRFWPSWWRRYKVSPLEILLLAMSLAGCVGVSRWFMWWGGGSYGPRLLCDLLPFAAILLVPVVDNLSLRVDRGNKLTVLFLLAGALGVAINARGATSAGGVEWCVTPIPIDEVPERAWAWRDPQFLRGIVAHSSASTTTEVNTPLPSFSEDIRSRVKSLSLHPMETTFVPIALRNTTSSLWSSRGKDPITISYKWFDNGKMLPIEGERTVLAGPLKPGDSASVQVKVVAPDSPRDLVLKISLVQEGVAWFMTAGAKPLEVPVAVD